MQKGNVDSLGSFEQDDLGRAVVNSTDRNMLRSILEKDNERIEKEIAGLAGDVVLEVVFEGGGFEVRRFTTDDGKTYFRASGTSMRLDDDDRDEWVEWKDAPTASFEGLLMELRMGTDLLCLKPVRIHADIREPLGRYIDGLIANVTAEERSRMGRYLARSAQDWLARAER